MARKAAAQVDEDTKPVEQPEPITEDVEVDVSETQQLETSEPTVVDTAAEAPSPPEEAPKPLEDDSEKAALRQRLNEMEQAVHLERQQREAAQRAGLQAQRERAQSQRQAWEDRYNAVTNLMGAAQSTIEAASQELEKAHSEGDVKLIVEAQRKLGRAESQLERAEYTKQQMDDQLEHWRRQQQQRPQQRQQPQPQPQRQQPVQQTSEQIIANSNLPDRAKTWLRQHSDYITDAAKNATIIALHDTAKRQAGSEWTDEYFSKMEDLLGLNAAQHPSGRGNGAAQPAHVRTAQVSAPPTREAPSMSTGRAPQSTRVTLSVAEQEIAEQIRESRGKNSDGSYKMSREQARNEYAKQKLLVKKRKDNGELS